jgi:hypothetical protein
MDGQMQPLKGLPLNCVIYWKDAQQKKGTETNMFAVYISGMPEYLLGKCATKKV